MACDGTIVGDGERNSDHGVMQPVAGIISTASIRNKRDSCRTKGPVQLQVRWVDEYRLRSIRRS